MGDTAYALREGYSYSYFSIDHLKIVYNVHLRCMSSYKAGTGGQVWKTVDNNL